MGTVIDSHFLALTAIVTVGYQFIFFIITALLKFDKVTDFAGSTNFVIIAVLTLILKGSWHFRQAEWLENSIFSYILNVGSFDIACANMGLSVRIVSFNEIREEQYLFVCLPSNVMLLKIDYTECDMRCVL
ncbi:Protein of unknown function DUF1295 [Dillenia turbinata]|uniref:Uncharacterized protein n=1 Tax=Dillenia turbinata TaxID=194707 RepID=A0AAN8Z373_9MAGN